MKISYKSVSDILSPKEMKNIKGGSGITCCCFDPCTKDKFCGLCAGPNKEECETYDCPPGFPEGPEC